MATYYRQDQNLITVKVGDTTLDAIWQSRSGGGSSAEESKVRLGGMKEETAMGGPVTTENVTVTAVYSDYLATKVHWLQQQIGKTRASVTQDILDTSGNPTGKTLTWSGIVQAVNPPEYDGTSSDAGVLELELSTDSSLGGSA